MPITSTRAVLQRLMIGRLKDRGVGVHRLAELARVPVPDVWRIVEFASLPAEPEQKRLLEVGWRLLDEVKLARARPGMRSATGAAHATANATRDAPTTARAER